MADCCFLVERRSVDAAMTSQVGRRHVLPLRPSRGAADRRRSSSFQAVARVSRIPASTCQVVLLLAHEGGRIVASLHVAVEHRPLGKRY
jgi:hypothetical protein